MLLLGKRAAGQQGGGCHERRRLLPPPGEPQRVASGSPWSGPERSWGARDPGGTRERKQAQRGKAQPRVTQHTVPARVSLGAGMWRRSSSQTPQNFAPPEEVSIRHKRFPSRGGAKPPSTGRHQDSLATRLPLGNPAPSWDHPSDLTG